MIKGCRSITEYAIRKWLEKENFVISCFELKFDGNTATIRDKNGDSLQLIYDRVSGTVNIGE